MNKLIAIWKVIISPEYLVLTTHGIHGSRKGTDFGKHIRALSEAIEQSIELDKNNGQAKSKP